MDIVQIDPGNLKFTRLFCKLPFEIYKDNPYWVPPLAFDINKMLNRKRHPFYQDGEAAFFISIDNQGKPISRIAVLINHKYNKFNNEKTGFFYLFESFNDLESTTALFSAAEKWLKSKGMNKFIGSKGFTVLDGIGILVEGFDRQPAFGLPYNPHYYQKLIESAGFTKETDMLSSVIDRSFSLPEKVLKVSEILQTKKQIEIKQFRSKKQVVEFLPEIRNLYNESLIGTNGNMPLSDQDISSMAFQFLWFSDPTLIKIILKDSKPIGFLLGYPDISSAIRSSQGKLFPFGWIKLLIETKKTTIVNINGAGILEQYRGSGATAVLYDEITKAIRNSRYNLCEIVQIGTDNPKMQLETEALGIKFSKRHRLYAKTVH